MASNPEFLKEGAALDDFFRPDRVFIGANDEATEEAMRNLYRPLQLSSERVLVMDRRSAELSKYAANAMLAVRISFMNEISQLCDALGADINSIRRAIGSDRRIGPHFLYAGPGYGGSCFPKDVSALSALADDHQRELSIVDAAANANVKQQDYVFDRVLSLFPDGVAKKVIAVWGLAFKPETDDVRESPAGRWCNASSRSAPPSTRTIRKPPPTSPPPTRPRRSYFDNEYDSVDGADALVVMTEWRHFRNPDLDELKRRMRFAEDRRHAQHLVDVRLQRRTASSTAASVRLPVALGDGSSDDEHRAEDGARHRLRPDSSDRTSSSAFSARLPRLRSRQARRLLSGQAQDAADRAEPRKPGLLARRARSRRFRRARGLRREDPQARCGRPPGGGRRRSPLGHRSRALRARQLGRHAKRARRLVAPFGIPLVFASSSSVYGNNSRAPFSEDEPCIEPPSPYAATKRGSELLCHVAHQIHGVPITMLRFFTVYGPRQRPDLAIRKFSTAILAQTRGHRVRRRLDGARLHARERHRARHRCAPCGKRQALAR